jgi:hypothetical protein
MGLFIRRYGLVFALGLYAAILTLLHGLRLFPRPGLYDVSRLIGGPYTELEGKVVDIPVVRWGQTRFLFEARLADFTAARP